jgi:hypothetical protein
LGGLERKPYSFHDPDHLFDREAMIVMA